MPRAVIALWFAFSVWAGASPIKLSPDSTIILLPAAPDDGEAKGSKLLQQCLRKVNRTGQGFEICAEDKAQGLADKTVLAVGRTRLAAGVDRAATLSRDGFIIKSAGNRLIIRGGSAAATFHGVCDFLDRFCGVRFYMPGELFTSLPDKTGIEVPEIERVAEPFVRNCMMTGMGNRPGERDLMERNAVVRKDAFNHQHSMWQRFPPEKFAAKFPEIYPILGGQRYLPAGTNDQKWQPCFSEPALLDAAVESAVGWFRQHPQVRHISFSVMDSHNFCQCPRCLGLIAQADGRKVTAYSRMCAGFLNALAARLEKELPAHGIAPDKTLVYIAYSEVREAPPFKLHKAILPVVVFTIADLLIDRRLDPASNIVDQWAAVAGQMGNHDWGEGMGYFIPRSYSGLTSQLFRYASRKGVVWGYQHFEAYPNWGLDGPKLYITPKIWWDPDTDVARLWRQFCDDMFPAAHAPMLEYFTHLEDLWIRMDNDAERKIRKWVNQFDLSPDQQQLVRRCRDLLDRAAAVARDENEQKRIELFSKTFRLSEYFFEIANAAAADPAKVEACRRHAREVIARDPMTVFGAPNTAAVMADVEQALKVITARKVTK